jgi:hypothetical protein
VTELADQHADQLVRHGLDTTNQFALKLRHDPAAISGARDGHVALQTSMGTTRDTASAQRVNLTSASSGSTTDRATATSKSLEQEVQDLLDESAEIEKAVAEAAETLNLGEIKNDQIRDQIIKEISASMKALAAVKNIQPPESRGAASRDILMKLQTKISQLTGQAATFSEQTINQLTNIGTQLGGPEQTTSSSSAAIPAAGTPAAVAAGEAVAVVAAVPPASRGCPSRSRRSPAPASRSTCPAASRSWRRTRPRRRPCATRFRSSACRTSGAAPRAARASTAAG